MTLAAAAESDLPTIRELARELLPDLTELHVPDWSHRLGSGRIWVESLLLVARHSSVPGNEPVGFAWVDAAMLHDEGVFEPWWCLNAVAVGSEYQGRGVGRALVDTVRKIASAAGVVSLYGICDQTLADWYTDRGFTVLAPGEKVVSDGLVRRSPSDGTMVSLDAEGECMFFTDIEPVASRRLIRE
ncbi:GNAT family N-acetyltransferase [Prescottella subtropica]|uniref:GNAT family N-acetyltransferase n=1 Tax=Prescottella subtropica TaxID=2545757 RepID=UPI001386B106|nr:GNAT family N-acetyltransferase [Prescottella subtropica]